MSRELVDGGVDRAVLEYRVEQLEKTQEKVVKAVENMGDSVVENNKEQALQKQRLYFLVATLVLVMNLVIDAGKTFFERDTYNDDDKKVYYERRINESDEIKKIREKLKELEKGKK